MPCNHDIRVDYVLLVSRACDVCHLHLVLLASGVPCYTCLPVSCPQVFAMHSQLLKKGFSLLRPPTISQALDGNLPFSCCSNERSFLKDFVACTPATSGGRLAASVHLGSLNSP